MTISDIEEMARELHWDIVYDDEGQIILLTGVIDEKNRQNGLGESADEEPMVWDEDVADDEDDDDWIEDEYTT